MTKLRKKLNVTVTILMILCICLCLFVCMQVIMGKEASVFGFRIYNILTGSMEPTIPTGTNVIVHEVNPETLKTGDIITFISEEAAIYGSANTHRIVAVETDEAGRLCFRTRGDANSAEDLLPVYPENIKGKVVFHMNASMASFFGFMRTKLGFATVILLPMMLLIGIVTRDFKKSIKEYITDSAMKAQEESAGQDTEPESEPDPNDAPPERVDDVNDAPPEQE